MSSPRKKHTSEQIALAVDYITENRTSIFHPEDKDLGFFVSYDQIQRKVAAMTVEAREGRNKRAQEYDIMFKKALSDYFEKNNPSCSGIRCDYAVGNRELLEAVKDTCVHFDSGFWEVSFRDGKVFSHSGKYDNMGTEVVRKTKVAEVSAGAIPPEETKASPALPNKPK